MTDGRTTQTAKDERQFRHDASAVFAVPFKCPVPTNAIRKVVPGNRRGVSVALAVPFTCFS